MEQKKHNNGNVEYGKGEEEVREAGFPVHSQVRRIKQEMASKAMDWFPGQPERRHVFKGVTRQRSLSPLGLGGRRISVGES